MTDVAGSVQDLWFTTDKVTGRKVQTALHGKGARWRVRWTVTTAAAGRQQFTKSFAAQKDAKAHLAQQLDGLRSGRQQATKSKETIAEASAAFLAAKTAAKKQATTMDLWTTVLTVHVLPRIGSVRCAELTPEQVADLYVELGTHGKANGRCRTAGVTCAANGCTPDQHQGLGSSIVRHSHTMLRAVLRWSLGRGVLLPTDDDKPRAALPELGPTRVSKSDYWTPVQAAAFLTSCADVEDPLRPVWALALATGLRRAELAGLVWSEVQLDGDKPHLWVERTATVVRGRVILREGGKTDSAVRRVPLGPEVVAILRAHREALDGRREASDEWDDTGFVFPDEHGRLINPRALTNGFTRATKVAGLPNLGLHGARHYAATTMLRKGVPVATVSNILGHKKPSITLAIYTHAIPEDDAVAAAAMDAAIAPGAGSGPSLTVAA